jgi:hypothetical protein
MADISWNRLLSVLIAVCYVILGCIMEGMAGAAIAALFSLLPLACIWFPDVLGEYAPSSSSFFGITAESPEGAVRFVGWMLLVLPAFLPVIAYVVL